MRDTIYAPATASGRAAVAVIRISGPNTARVMEALCGRLPPARHVALRTLRSGGEVLDQAVVIWLPGPGSFTGEDAGELQTHGGPAVVAAVCGGLDKAGARLAEPGEFTRRAFEAGRLDLTQAEAIADLVDAETEAQRRQATAQLSGALSDKYRTWRERLLNALAKLEGGIDFPEDDIPDGLSTQAKAIVQTVIDEQRRELDDERGMRTRDGLRIVLVGAPNVGKSSLINALTGRDVAIVTPIEGTTRDVIEAHAVIGGHQVILTDTAGLRETDDPIELEGVARARRAAGTAGIRVLVADASRQPTVEFVRSLERDNDIRVLNKIDLSPDWQRVWPEAVGAMATKDGVQSLLAAITDRVKGMMDGASSPAITRKRHQDVLKASLAHLMRATSAVDPELIGEDVRLALRELYRVEGRLDPEAVLDLVFSTFCIGK